MIIHDIYMQPIGTGSGDSVGFLSQTGKICRQNTGGNQTVLC